MKHLIMDATGHSTIEFNPLDSGQASEAMERFRALTGNGHVAATRKAGETDYQVIKTPDQQQDETLFVPQMRGG